MMEQTPSEGQFLFQPQHMRLKIITLGEARVGKTCLVKKFCEPRRVVVGKYFPTIGVDYGVKTVSKGRDGEAQTQDIKIEFYDLSGDPDYCEVRNEFYDNTKALLLVFDVTRKSSFEKLSAWLAEAAKFGLTSESAIVIIVANKTEQNPREVTEQEVSRRCILIAQSRLDPGEPSIWYSSGHVICNGKRCTIFRNKRQNGGKC